MTALLGDVYAKLDWAEQRYNDMQGLFEAYAKPGVGDEQPIGIHFRERSRPGGLVVAFFIVEQPMPVEMSLLAADVVHNTRVALDHVLARLKEHFGGDPGKGWFPTWQTERLWQENIVRKGRRSTLYGLDPAAVELVYAEQPLHRPSPETDPLAILNKLDNADKHRLLHPAFVYTAAERGIDLIQVRDRKAVKTERNLWTAGQPLRHGTQLAMFMISGEIDEVLGRRHHATVGFASGEVGAPRTSYLDMISRVRGVVDKAAALLER